LNIYMGSSLIFGMGRVLGLIIIHKICGCFMWIVLKFVTLSAAFAFMTSSAFVEEGYYAGLGLSLSICCQYRDS